MDQSHTLPSRENFYHAFEAKYRGNRELIKSRLQVYRPFVEPILQLYPNATALDLGCGRGEWLELLKEWGLEAVGVDIDPNVIKACDGLGVKAYQIEALQYLKDQLTESHALITAFHLVEHLSFDGLFEIVTQSLRVLRPGGLLILETPNPENFYVATTNFYLDPTHIRPVPPLLLEFVVSYAGFEKVKLLRLNEPKGISLKTQLNVFEALGGVGPDYSVVAQKGPVDASVAEGFKEAFGRKYGMNREELYGRHILEVNDRYQKLELLATTALLKAQQAQDSYHKLELLATTALLKAQQAQDSALSYLRELEAVYNSRSWRLTRPLRFLHAKLFRLKAFDVKLGLKKLLKAAGMRLYRSPKAYKTIVWLLGHTPSLEARLAGIFRDLTVSVDYKQELASAGQSLSPMARAVYEELRLLLNKKQRSKA